MKLDEAIDRNKELKVELIREGWLEMADAVQLGIEAFIFIQNLRISTPGLAHILLKGETEK